MSARKLATQRGGLVDAEGRLKDAVAYLDLASVSAGQRGAARSACVGNAVLAGIAASDAVCLAVLGERYAGQDHSAAAELLERVSKDEAKALRRLVSLKAAAHYGGRLLSSDDESRALRSAQSLVARAYERVRGGS